MGGTFLGEDLGRRRYWVLGGQAGAWSVHVEAPDGRRWGCYHGRAVRKLLAWLEAGGVFPPEAALVAALKAAPLPPWEQQAAAAEAEAASAAEGAAAKGVLPCGMALALQWIGKKGAGSYGLATRSEACSWRYIDCP